MVSNSIFFNPLNLYYKVILPHKKILPKDER